MTYLMAGDPGDKVLKVVQEKEEPAAMAVAAADEIMPPLEVRWAHTGTKQLALPTAPVSGLDASFKAFSADESDRIEAAWQAMSADERRAIVNLWGKGDGEWSEDPKKTAKKVPKTVKKPAGDKKAQAGAASGTESEAVSVDEEVLEKNEQYKSIIEKAQNDSSRLDTVKGVPVSQVS